MTTQEKLIRKKLSLIELAEYLQNVSQACKINGVSRQHFYDIKKAYEEEGLEGLREKSRRRLCIKKRRVGRDMPHFKHTVPELPYFLYSSIQRKRFLISDSIQALYTLKRCM